MTRTTELQQNNPHHEIQDALSENTIPRKIDDIRETYANKVLGILIAIAAGCAVINCYGLKYKTREMRHAPETTDSEAGQREFAVDCSPGEKKCDEDGKYFLCVHIEGQCACNDVEQTRTRTHCTGSIKDGTKDCESIPYTVIGRSCTVSGVSFQPPNIEELVGEPVSDDKQADALKCFPGWNSRVGNKSGSLWANIPSEDRRCRPEKPIE